MYSRVVIESIGKLPAGKYTLEVANIRDRVAIGNTMVPQTLSIDVTNTDELKLVRAWYDDSDRDDLYIDVQFNRAVATSGNGSALDINKYSYVVTGNVYKVFPTKNAPQPSLRNADTVRITIPKEDFKDYVNELKMQKFA